MQVNREALDKAIKALAIRDVFFRDERVVLREDITPQFFAGPFRTQFKITTRILHDFEAANVLDDGQPNPSTAQRYVEIEFVGAVRCLAVDDSGELLEGDKQEVLSMEVSIGLLYAVTQECEDDCLEEFVRANAAYHAIPYWREHVHATCVKRRFPPITVPMYLAMTAKEPEVVITEVPADTSSTSTL